MALVTPASAQTPAIRWYLIQFQESASAPPTPAANRVTLYALDAAGTATLYAKDDGGTVHDLFATSGVGSCAASKWVSALNANAAPTCTQPGFSDLSGTAALAQITDDAATNKVLHSGGAGDPTWSAVVSGDITDGTVAYADIQNLAALTVMGRSANSSGVGADISGTAGQVLRVSSLPALAFGSIDLASSAAVGSSVLPVANGGSYRHLVELGSDIGSSASTAFQDITGLSWAVTNGVNYRYECYIAYTASANTIGLRVSYTSPSTTLAAYTTTVTPPSTTGGVPTPGTAINWVNWQTANDSGTVSAASMNTTAGNLLIMQGFIRPSASGTMQLRFAPETATSNGIVIKTGSTCEYW